MTRVCPKLDAVCPHGDDCPFNIDRHDCRDDAPTEGGDVAGAVERLSRFANGDGLLEVYPSSLHAQDLHREDVRAVLAARPTGGEIAGWKLVPVEPTFELVSAMGAVIWPDLATSERHDLLIRAWKVGLAASPSRKDGQ